MTTSNTVTYGHYTDEKSPKCELQVSAAELHNLRNKTLEIDTDYPPDLFNFFANHMVPWSDQWEPWRGMRHFYTGMNRMEYHFMLLSFLFEAKMAGDI